MIGGLVLAAGAGTRFGSEPKLLADLDGRPVLQHAVEAITQVSAIERVVVVLGAHAEELLAHVRYGRAEPVLCERWIEGQSASLRCGVAALEGSTKIVVTLGDQPFMTPQIVERFTRASPGSRATYDGAPGHPVVLGARHAREIQRLTGDHGARDILDGPLIEVDCPAASQDLDTHEDLQQIREVGGQVARGPARR